MSEPMVVWEADLAEELKQSGSSLLFIALGKSDANDDEVIGWYVMLHGADGTFRIMLQRVKYKPRLYKTYLGLKALVREILPDSTTITVPIVPDVRAEVDVWTKLDELNSKTQTN